MQVLHYTPDLQLPHHTVITMGNFDGVHLGHHILLEKTVLRAEQQHVFSAVVTFEPHTRHILKGDTVPRISTAEEKALLIEPFGIDYFIIFPFSLEIAALGRNEFRQEVLFKQFNCIELVMGEGHRFGKKEPSSEKTLSFSEDKKHISTIRIQLYGENQRIVSSTAIRNALFNGELDQVMNMLGHPYLILATRVRGLHLGTKLGYPTLNFTSPPSQKIVPPPGVFVGEVKYGNHSLKGCLYYGDCPTFGNREMHFEFFSLDLIEEEPEVDMVCQLLLHSFVRKNQSFESSDALVAQIAEDVKIIKKHFMKD